MVFLQIISIYVISFKEVFFDFLFLSNGIGFDFISEGFWTFESVWKRKDQIGSQLWDHYIVWKANV